jgi:hypothetical protein
MTGVRSGAADEQLLAESALLNANEEGRAQGAEAQRLATLQKTAPRRRARLRGDEALDHGRRGRDPLESPRRGEPVADLLDVFNSYDGSVLFRGLTEGVGGQPSVLGRIGWIFTGFGALFALWGFVLRTQRSNGEGKMGEVAKTWIVIAFMVGGPFIMRAAMQAADGVYAVGRRPAQPHRGVRQGGLRHAGADGALRRPEEGARSPGRAEPQARQPAQRRALINSANDGSVLGYLEAFGVAVWDTATDYASGAGQTWNGMVRIAALATGFGSAMLKCLLIALTILPLYLLLLCGRRDRVVHGAAALLSRGDGDDDAPALHRDVLAARGPPQPPGGAELRHAHGLARALARRLGDRPHRDDRPLQCAVSLIAGTSRVPEMVGVLQWSSITAGAPVGGAAPGDGGGARKLVHGQPDGPSLDPGRRPRLRPLGRGRVGPRARFLHKLLATGALFMTQAAGRRGPPGGRRGQAGAQRGADPGIGRGAGLLGQGRRRANACPARARRTATSIADEGPPPAGAPGRRREHGHAAAAWMIRVARPGRPCDNGACHCPASSDPQCGAPSASSTASSASRGGRFSQLPEFMQQYLQRLEGHLDEARLAARAASRRPRRSPE